MTSILLHAEGISARRGARTVLEPCTLSIAPGDRVAIYGPNGAGKSTMLQALAGLLPVASGSIAFRGRKLGQALSLLDFHRQTAAVFQEPLLLRGTVRHNVELGLVLRGVEAAERVARVEPWLERLHIAHLADRSVSALSGGEAQRTSLARALVLEPEIFFLDEPFAALDAPTRARLAEELADILDERKIATLFVTHDIDEAAQMCDRCVVIDAGRVLQQADMSEVLGRPASARVADIIGLPNVFQGRVIETTHEGTWLDWCGHRIRTTAQARAGADVTFLIRPEQIRLQGRREEGANRLPGHVEQARRGGRRRFVVTGVGGPHRIAMSFAHDDHALPGDEVAILFPPDAVWIFPEQDPGPDESR